MKLTSTIISLVAFFAFASADNVYGVSYDSKYDSKEHSLSSIACPILHEKGFKTFGSLPNFPNIGASPLVARLKYPTGDACGTCWDIRLTDKMESPIYVLAVGLASDGFQLSNEAMKTLTNGTTEKDKTVTAYITKAGASHCGL
jgi:hypothetical protein